MTTTMSNPITEAAGEFLETVEGDANVALRMSTDLTTLGLNEFGLNVITDIRGQLWKRGRLSEKQVAFVARLLAQVDEQASRKPEETVAHPVGRVTFDGVVIKRTWKDSDYGGGFKIIVKVTEGQNANGEDRVWLVWVSEPAAIETTFGDTVRLTATLKTSNKPYWAWGSRPSAATITGHKDDQLPDALAD